MPIESMVVLGLATAFLVGLAVYASSHRAEDARPKPARTPERRSVERAREDFCIKYRLTVTASVDPRTISSAFRSVLRKSSDSSWLACRPARWLWRAAVAERFRWSVRYAWRLAIGTAMFPRWWSAMNPPSAASHWPCSM